MRVVIDTNVLISAIGKFSPNRKLFDAILNGRDDNKFIYCCIVSNSDYLITNDKHFDIAKKSEFPEINVISSNEFIMNILI